MTDYRDPKTGERTAVLRPEDPQLALRRLTEWNALRDEADAIDPKTRMLDRAEADARAMRHWISALKEQGWRFVGWVDAADAKLTSGGPGAAGDLHVTEKQYRELFRPA